ncbi:hypothetical protein [Yersinia enterocolitica]|nr:hypothetical protein [Yersinia enterocolitica]
MPESLTAGNGAKGALSGEFFTETDITCEKCGGNYDEHYSCERCNDLGVQTVRTVIGWSTIKAIYKMAVDTTAIRPTVSRSRVMQMLSKEQLEKRIAEIRNIASEMKWSSVEHGQVALNDAEALEELLSLREQLAELKALPPVAWRWRFCAQNVVTLDKDRAEKSNEMGVDDFTELFTAAKPAEIPRHIFSMLVNELRDVPAIGCKRELIIGVLNRHGVIAEPVQCDPPAAE